MIEIKNGRVFIDDEETVDPTLIGYAILDMAEQHQKPNGTLIFREDAEANQ